jgi:hypothetical protein
VPGLSDRGLVKAVVSYLYEAQLLGERVDVPELPDVWDVWYVCYRLWRSAGELGMTELHRRGTCPGCSDLVTRLTSTEPPAYPSALPDCGCWLRWAMRMRSRGRGATDVDSSAMALSFALVKPGAPAEAIHSLLGARYRTVGRRELGLTAVDVSRLYPDAYGEEFLAWQAEYLGRGPVEVLVLAAPTDEAVCAVAVRSEIRAALGVAAEAENHLHMPDSPGEALANIEQFFGSAALAEQYGRIERIHGYRRLAVHRALLGG